MKVVLAEKPSVARELASFLGATARRDGYFEGGGYRVTWALGHLATLKEPHDYDPALKRWTLESLPFVPDEFGLKPVDTDAARKQLAVVRKLLKEADELIAATDAGREGELIFRYVQELCGATRKPARRLWLSSLTKAAIRDAFRKLRPLSDYDRLYAAARCRSEADWVVGLNATRCHTVRHRPETGLLWSVGRVQTPVLALVVRRDDEIRSFKPEPFWELSTRYRDATFRFVGGRFAKEEDARATLAQVEGRPFAVTGVARKPERVRPPQLYDLTDLQRDMNRRYGLSADATLKAAQSLYEAKLITYPRTDSRHLGRDMKPKVAEVLERLRPLKPAEVGRLDLTALPFSPRIIDDAKVTDHHAVVPTGKTPGSLGPAERKVFDAVLTRLIAALSPDCRKEVTTVDGESAGVKFRAKGVRVLDPGWTALYPRKGDAKRDSKPVPAAKNKPEAQTSAEAAENEQELPEFRVGETGPHDPSVRRGETAPPKPYTEGDLLGAMETAGRLVDDEALKEALRERGLGTPATRASVIETLLDRGYVVREGKTLAATDAGRYLIAVVRDERLKSAELTGDWEAKLRAVERGELAPSAFMEEVVRYAREIVRGETGSEADGGEAAEADAALGGCPRCGRPVIAGKADFGCSAWRDGCGFVLRRDQPGGPLSNGDVRRLLRQRVLLRPAKPERPRAVLLRLLDSGDVTEIAVPTGSRDRTAGETRQTGGRRKAGPKRTGLRKGSGTLRTDAAHDGSSPRRSGKAKGTGDGAPSSAASLGACPLCGSAVVERDRCYGCEGKDGGCRFAVWKTIAGKKIGVRAARTLLRDGRTEPLKGFTSKAGKPFEARLRLEAGEVRFDFGS